MYTTDELYSHVVRLKDPALFEQWHYLRKALQINPPDVLKVGYLKLELTDMINSRKRLPMEWSFLIMEKIRSEFEAIKNASWATTEFKLSAYEQMLESVLPPLAQASRRERLPHHSGGDPVWGAAINGGRERVRQQQREMLRANPSVYLEIVRRLRGGERQRVIAKDMGLHSFAVSEVVKMLEEGAQ